MSRNGMRPMHPGEILRDELDTLQMSAKAFAVALHVPGNRNTAILNGRRSVTAGAALRLSRYLGTTAEFWLNLQKTFELRTAEKRTGEQIVKRIKPQQAARMGPSPSTNRRVVLQELLVLHRFICRDFADEGLRHMLPRRATRVSWRARSAHARVRSRRCNETAGPWIAVSERGLAVTPNFIFTDINVPVPHHGVATVVHVSRFKQGRVSQGSKQFPL